MTTDGLWESFIGNISFLTESEASDQAKKMGLIYAGYGRWKDPRTGKIVAKTIDGKLVKIENGEELTPEPEEPELQSPQEPELPDDHFANLAASLHTPKQKGGENTFDIDDAEAYLFAYSPEYEALSDKQVKFLHKQLNRIKNAKTTADVFNAGAALKKAQIVDKDKWKKLLEYTKAHRPDLEKYTPAYKQQPKALPKNYHDLPFKDQVNNILGTWIKDNDLSGKIPFKTLQKIEGAISVGLTAYPQDVKKAMSQILDNSVSDDVVIDDNIANDLIALVMATKKQPKTSKSQDNFEMFSDKDKTAASHVLSSSDMSVASWNDEQIYDALNAVAKALSTPIPSVMNAAIIQWGSTAEHLDSQTLQKFIHHIESAWSKKWNQPKTVSTQKSKEQPAALSTDKPTPQSQGAADILIAMLGSYKDAHEHALDKYGTSGIGSETEKYWSDVMAALEYQHMQKKTQIQSTDIATFIASLPSYVGSVAKQDINKELLDYIQNLDKGAFLLQTLENIKNILKEYGMQDNDMNAVLNAAVKAVNSHLAKNKASTPPPSTKSTVPVTPSAEKAVNTMLSKNKMTLDQIINWANKKSKDETQKLTTAVTDKEKDAAQKSSQAFLSIAAAAQAMIDAPEATEEPQPKEPTNPTEKAKWINNAIGQYKDIANSYGIDSFGFDQIMDNALATHNEQELGQVLAQLAMYNPTGSDEEEETYYLPTDVIQNIKYDLMKFKNFGGKQDDVAIFAASNEKPEELGAIGFYGKYDKKIDAMYHKLFPFPTNTAPSSTNMNLKGQFIDALTNLHNGDYEAYNQNLDKIMDLVHWNKEASQEINKSITNAYLDVVGKEPPAQAAQETPIVWHSAWGDLEDETNSFIENNTNGIPSESEEELLWAAIEVAKDKMATHHNPNYKGYYAAIIQNLEKKYAATGANPPATISNEPKEPKPTLTKAQTAADAVITKFKGKIPAALTWAKNKQAEAKYAKKKQWYADIIAHLESKLSSLPGQPKNAANPVQALLGPKKVDKTNAAIAQQTVKPTAQPVLSASTIHDKYNQPSSQKIYSKYFTMAMNAKSLADMDHALAQLNGIGNLDAKKITDMRKDLLALHPELLPPDTTKMDLQKEFETNVQHKFFQQFPMPHKTPEEIAQIKEMLLQACHQPTYQDMKKVLQAMKDKGMIGDSEFLAMKDMGSGIPAMFNAMNAKKQQIEQDKLNALAIEKEKKAMEKKLASLTPETKAKFDNIYQQLTSSGTIPASSLPKIQDIIMGSMLADDAQDLIDKLMPLNHLGVPQNIANKVRGNILNTFLNSKSYNPTTPEPPVSTASNTRLQQITDKWVDETGFGLGHLPVGEQHTIKSTILNALTCKPDEVDDTMISLNFNTSLTAAQINDLRNLVIQERQKPGIFAPKVVTTTPPQSPFAPGAPTPPPVPSIHAPYGVTASGKAKKPPKPVDRIGKKIAALGNIPPDKQQAVKMALAAVIKSYETDPHPYLYGVSNKARQELYKLGISGHAAHKLALFARGEVKKGYASGYTTNGMLDVAAIMKKQAASPTATISTPKSISGGHSFANKTLVNGEQVNYDPKKDTPPFGKYGHASSTSEDMVAAKKQAAELQKNLPPKLYERLKKAIGVIKSHSWFNQTPEYRKPTNETLTRVVGGPPPAITTVSNWIERGMQLSQANFAEFIKAFKIGQKTYLGPSEFTLSSGTSHGYGGANSSNTGGVKVLMRVKPSKTGKLKALHVHNNGIGSHSSEEGVFIGMQKNLVVQEVIKHIYANGAGVAYEIIMQQDDPDINEAFNQDAPQFDKFGLQSHYWSEDGLSKRTQAILIKYMNGPMDIFKKDEQSQAEPPMNNETLNSVIRTELKKIMGESTINMDPFSYTSNFSNTDNALSPGSKLMQTPGAPFGGNQSAFSQMPMNNESRLALKDWLRFVKAAWKKFGAPTNWPKKYSQIAVELGQKYENLSRPQNTSIGYRP